MGGCCLRGVGCWWLLFEGVGCWWLLFEVGWVLVVVV